MSYTEKDPVEILEEPIPPTPSECCGGGSCCPCVWDFYFEQKRLWQEQQKALKEADTAEQKDNSQV
ncbi:MAG: hypothetical protein EA373_02610 [Oceanospirillales bacterium]|nr:MAG: hypothetical protein EA373_02610 [Oceanospirillales bacterium]